MKPKSLIATPDDIRTAATKKIDVLMEHVVAGDVETLFPMRLRVRLKPNRISDVSLNAYADACQVLVQQSKAATGRGYRVHLRRRRSRGLGEQDFPDHVTVDTRCDFEFLTACGARLEQTRLVCGRVREAFPTLENWLRANARRLDRHADVVDDLIAVAKALTARPMPDCYLRELDVPVDTKFIEEHQTTLRHWLDQLLPPNAIFVTETSFSRRYGLRDGLPHHLIRFLDGSIGQRIGFPCDELSLPMQVLTKLSIDPCSVIIVENRTNLLTLPEIMGAIALGGVGDSATRLRDIPWLHECRLFYWGDLDIDGFRILANMRKLFPRLRSVLMDQATFDKHRSQAVAGNGRTSGRLATLTDEENRMLEQLSDENLRLEQEQIGQSFVCECMRVVMQSH